MISGSPEQRARGKMDKNNRQIFSEEFIGGISVSINFKIVYKEG